MTTATETETTTPPTAASGSHGGQRSGGQPSGGQPSGTDGTDGAPVDPGVDVDVFGAALQSACDELAGLVGRAAACRATGVPRSSWYRDNRISPLPPRPAPKPHTERVQPRALSAAERARVRGLLNTEPYLDHAPATVWAKLLDAGQYHCSISTMYRILREHDEVRERRRQATHPARKKPELLATAPNQVWSWDITKLAGPRRGIWYHAYVIIDIYSRYNPGWMIAETESGELARRFLDESITKHDIDPDTLTLHSDRGTSMKSKTVAELLSDLRVTKSHSRPKTSNDNPYSESQFKTFVRREVARIE